MEFRNIAIIAHVDHGKTTLVDEMLKQGNVFRQNEQVMERVMDSNDLERERGITIYAKNTSIFYKDTKFNIVDTPGHADFGSEVERVLKMIDSVLLLVDAYEGPMPQTRFVLKKSLELGIKPIVVINKIDKPTARPDEVVSLVFDLFVELGATDAQLDFAHIYTIARDGIAKKELSDDSKDLTPLFDLILEKVAVANFQPQAPLKLQCVNLGYDNYLGRLCIGRIQSGTIKKNQNVFVKLGDAVRKGKITNIKTAEGLRQVEVDEAVSGDIVTIAGIPDIYIGETILDIETEKALDPIHIDPPTLTVNITVNDSPFAGKDGTLVTTRHIRARLEKELETNVGLKVEFPDGDDVYRVSGRGELHIAVLLEQMRREGFELQVAKPQVILKEENGVTLEPIEYVFIECDSSASGTVIEKLSKRKAEMINMRPGQGSLVHIEFYAPTRGLLGYQSDFVTDTKGEGIYTHIFHSYGPYKGDIPQRYTGSMISQETGPTTAYALDNLQDRATLLVGAGVEVYQGMVIGICSKDQDLVVNPIKGKKLTNMRASGSDDTVKLTPALIMTLEKAISFIQDDELVEITPLNIRIRKKFLTENDRKRNK